MILRFTSVIVNTLLTAISENGKTLAMNTALKSGRRQLTIEQKKDLIDWAREAGDREVTGSVINDKFVQKYGWNLQRQQVSYWRRVAFRSPHGHSAAKIAVSRETVGKLEELVGLGIAPSQADAVRLAVDKLYAHLKGAAV